MDTDEHNIPGVQSGGDERGRDNGRAQTLLASHAESNRGRAHDRTSGAQFPQIDLGLLLLVYLEEERRSKMKTYHGEDRLGPLPAKPTRINFSRNNGWLEQLGANGWFKVARRGRKQPWVSLFSNLRVEQKSPDDPIDFIKVQ